ASRLERNTHAPPPPYSGSERPAYGASRFGTQTPQARYRTRASVSIYIPVWRHADGIHPDRVDLVQRQARSLERSESPCAGPRAPIRNGGLRGDEVVSDRRWAGDFPARRAPRALL